MFAGVAVLVMLVMVGLKTKSIQEEWHRSDTASRHEGTSLQADFFWPKIPTVKEEKWWQEYQFQSPEEERRLEPVEKRRESEALEEIKRLQNGTER